MHRKIKYAICNILDYKIHYTPRLSTCKLSEANSVIIFKKQFKPPLFKKKKKKIVTFINNYIFCLFVHLASLF